MQVAAAFTPHAYTQTHIQTKTHSRQRFVGSLTCNRCHGSDLPLGEQPGQVVLTLALCVCVLGGGGWWGWKV